MSVPKINDGEEITSYLKRLEEYKLSLIQEKYSVLLDFVNFWLDKSFKSLSEFKNIPETTLLKDLKHNRKTLRTFSKKLTKIFSKTFSVDDDTDSDDITDKYIIYVLTKLLVSINYSLTSKKIPSKDSSEILLYSIRQK